MAVELALKITASLESGALSATQFVPSVHRLSVEPSQTFRSPPDSGISEIVTVASSESWPPSLTLKLRLSVPEAPPFGV